MLHWNTEQCDDLSQYGDLVLEGNFKLLGTKTNRQIFLFEEMLLIAKEKPDKSLCCKDYILCSCLMLNESVQNEPLAFQVLAFDNPRLQYTLLARSLEQKRQWTKELKRMMLDHYNIEIPKHTKNLVLSMEMPRLAASVAHSNSNGSSASSRASKRVPKYLEKRRKSVDTKAAAGKFLRGRSQSASRVFKAASASNLLQPTSTTGFDSLDDGEFECSSMASASIAQERSVDPATRNGPLFARRKSGEVSRAKFFASRKKPSLPPSPYRFETAVAQPLSRSRFFDQNDYAGRNGTASSSQTANPPVKQQHQVELHPPPLSQKRLLASDEIERTFAELWDELNQFSAVHGAAAKTANGGCGASRFPVAAQVAASVGAAADPEERLNSLIDGVCAGVESAKSKSLSPKSYKENIAVISGMKDATVTQDVSLDDEDSSIASCYDTPIESVHEDGQSVEGRNLLSAVDGFGDRHSLYRKNTAPLSHLVNIRDQVRTWEQRRHSLCVFGSSEMNSGGSGERRLIEGEEKLDPMLGVVQQMVKQFEVHRQGGGERGHDLMAHESHF